MKMKYIKTYESFKLNEGQDMMFMPVDPIAKTMDVYADVFNSAKEAFVDIKDDLVGGWNKLKEVLSELADFIFENIGMDKAIEAISKIFGFKANEGFMDDYEGRQTYNHTEPNALLEFFKSIDFKDVLAKIKEKAKEFGDKFKEYEGIPNMSNHDGKVSYKGFAQGFLGFIQSVLYVGTVSNLLTAGIGGKLVAELFGITLTIWSSLGYIFLGTLVAVLVFMLIRKTIYALSGGKVA